MKKIKIFVPLVLFLICVAGFFFFLTDKKEEAVAAKKNIVEQDITKINDLDGNKNTNVQVKTKNISDNTAEKSISTEGFVSETQGDNFYYASAIREKNILECDKIIEKKSAEDCRDAIFLEVSLKENSLEGCEKIEKETLQKYCSDTLLLKKAEQEKKFDLCENINSPYTKYDCFEKKDAYLFKTVLTKEDCSLIALDDYKERCTRRFFTENDFAFETKICTRLEDEEDRFLCEKMTISSAFSEGKFVNCRDFTGETLEYCIQKERETKDEYFFTQAVENKNYTYCTRIVSKSLEEDCTTQVVYLSVWEKKDISLCEKIPDKDIAKKCTEEEGSKIDTFFYRKAMRDQNKLLCVKIRGVPLQEKCVQLFAK